MSENSTKHECSEFIRKVELALDGELTATEEQEFIADAQRCGWCLEQYEIEKAFKNFLAQKLQRKPISATLVENIKAKIRETT